MRICVDFDGVIFDKTKGHIISGSMEYINKLSTQGHEITIFTNRPDYDYTTVKSVLDSNQISFDRIICGKPSYDVFIDDRAVKFDGWDKEYV